MNDITFSKLLSSVMLDNRYDRYVKNRRTGKLNTRSLYKIDTSSRLFKRREARKNKDYAVSLVVDCSGSMSGNKICMAAESAAKLSHHLSKIAIPHNVVTFNVSAVEVKPFNTKETLTLEQDIVGETHGSGSRCNNGKLSSDTERFFFWEKKYKRTDSGKEVFPFLKMTTGSRETNDFYNKLEKECGARGQSVHSNYLMFSGPNNNSDAEALAYARRLLLKQKGTKLMVFLSDGMPAPISSELESPIHKGRFQGEFGVKLEVENTLRSGVELYSIGIMDSSVTKYYPPRRTAAIKTLAQLYPHIIKLIKINLKRG